MVYNNDLLNIGCKIEIMNQLTISKAVVNSELRKTLNAKVRDRGLKSHNGRI